MSNDFIFMRLDVFKIKIRITDVTVKIDGIVKKPKFGVVAKKINSIEIPKIVTI